MDQTTPFSTDTVVAINEHITQAYDKRTYNSSAFPFSNPAHLQAAAYLYGLDSVPLEKHEY